MNNGTAGQQQQQQQQQQQEPQQPQKWYQKKWFRILVYLGLVSAGGAAGWISRGCYDENMNADDTTPTPEPDPQPQPKYYNNNNRPYNGGNDNRGGQK